MGKDIGMQKFRKCPPGHEPYYIVEHMKNRQAHEDHLNEQLTRLDNLMNK